MTSEALYHLILTTAQANTAILMMGSEGSRNDPSVTPDPYQDFDITYFVSDADFVDFQQFDRSHFGDIMIQQILPEENRWCWLMQFMDGNRLDLKIQPVSSSRIIWQLTALTRSCWTKQPTTPNALPHQTEPTECSARLRPNSTPASQNSSGSAPTSSKASCGASSSMPTPFLKPLFVKNYTVC